MKNYYEVLRIEKFCNSQDVIKQAYKNATEQLRSIVLTTNVESTLFDINEAYLVLSDSTIKARYDYILHCGQGDPKLDELIAIKRNQAEKFINDRLSQHMESIKDKQLPTKIEQSPTKVKRVLWPIGVVLLVILIFFVCIILFGKNYGSVNHSEVTPYNPPKSWKYFHSNLISLSIPPTMEIRRHDDPYTIWLYRDGGTASEHDVIFQQKGLANMTDEGHATYARILIDYYKNHDLENAYHHDESPELTSEDIEDLNYIVKNNIYPYRFATNPTFKWIDVGGNKIIEGVYKRMGNDGIVNCRFYLIQNYDDAVTIVLSYRDSDKDVYEEDFEKIIRTFKWKHPH